MDIKDFSQFIGESTKFDYGCVMININFPNWDRITSIIDEEDVYKTESVCGIETLPHITLLYGLHSEVSNEDITNCLKDIDFDNLEIQISGINIFEGEDFDVVKFNIVKNEILEESFNSLSQLPNSNEFEEYIPHITIAYVKSECGKKYKMPYSHTISKIDSVVYTRPDKIIFKIK